MYPLVTNGTMTSGQFEDLDECDAVVALHSEKFGTMALSEADFTAFVPFSDIL